MSGNTLRPVFWIWLQIDTTTGTGLFLVLAKGMKDLFTGAADLSDFRTSSLLSVQIQEHSRLFCKTKD
jgi:hypothetical protein